MLLFIRNLSMGGSPTSTTPSTTQRFNNNAFIIVLGG